MKLTAVELSEAGEIVEPSVHDGGINGLNLTSDHGLIISISTYSKKNVCLVLSGVDRFCANDFREGNTILDITVYESNEVNASLIGPLYFGKRMDEKIIADKLNSIRDDNLILVQINPAYGCSLVCVCEGIGWHY
jgi:hypothetical protein